jgi:hypothetical protein
MLVGPFVSLGSYVLRPLQLIPGLNWELIVSLGAIFLLFLFIFWILFRKNAINPPAAASQIDRRSVNLYGIELDYRLSFPGYLKSLAKLALTGFFMLALAYPLTFTIPAHVLTGRASRVHLSAGLGASITLTALMVGVLYLTKAYKRKDLLFILAAGCSTLLIGYGFLIQADYQRSWAIQREVWSQVIALAHDAGEGDVILVSLRPDTNPEQIKAMSWGTSLILDQLYQFPEEWEQPPQAFLLLRNWRNWILDDDLRFQINKKTASFSKRGKLTFESEDVILLEMERGELERRTSPFELNGHSFRLKEPGESVLAKLSTKRLYDYLIE